jgi:hypothetical protein
MVIIGKKTMAISYIVEITFDKWKFMNINDLYLISINGKLISPNK